MHYCIKITLILYLTFYLSIDVYSVENEVSTLEKRLTDMEYFIRLLEFTSGLMVILCLALLVLLIIYMRRNRIKSRQISQYAQNQGLASQKSAVAATDDNLIDDAEKRTVDRAFNNDLTAKKMEGLAKEIGMLKQKLVQEQQLRKQMEDEVAVLLSRLKRI